MKRSGIVVFTIAALLSSSFGALAAPGAAKKWKAIIYSNKDKAEKSDGFNLEEITEALGSLDQQQYEAGIDLKDEPGVLEGVTNVINATRAVYLIRKTELETPPNVFAGGVEFSVTAYEDNIKVKYDFQEPKPGFQFLALQVEVANKSRATVGIYSSNFVLKNEKGQIFKPTSDRVEPDFPGSMDVEPGERLSGWITYEIPADNYKEKMRIKYDGGKKSSRWVQAWE